MPLLIKTTTSARSCKLLKMAASHLIRVPSAVFMESHTFMSFPVTEILSGAKTVLSLETSTGVSSHLIMFMRMIHLSVNNCKIASVILLWFWIQKDNEYSLLFRHSYFGFSFWQRKTESRIGAARHSVSFLNESVEGMIQWCPHCRHLLV